MRSIPRSHMSIEWSSNCVATLCVGFDSAHLNVHRSPPETGNLGINLCGHPAFRRSCGDEHDGSIHSPAEIRAGVGHRYSTRRERRCADLSIQDFRSGGRPDVSLDQAGRAGTIRGANESTGSPGAASTPTSGIRRPTGGATSP